MNIALTACAFAAALAGLGPGSAARDVGPVVLVQSNEGRESRVPAQPHDPDGVLDIRSDPPARIVIDDKDTGKITPDQVSLKPGHHSLRLVTPDGKLRRTIGFTVEANQVTRLSIHLKPEHRD
jgi:hypothetical protein